jgi:hypothetical protein
MENDDEKEINPEDFQFTYSMDKWDKKKDPITSIPIILFQMDINSDISKNKWTINKTVDDFKNFINELSKICLNLPPKPKFVKINNDSSLILNNLCSEINDYLKNIIYRADVFNSKVFINFFELDKHFDKIKQFSPDVKFKINNLKYEVCDMIFLDDYNLLIIGCAKKVEKNFFDKKLFTKVKSFFKKENLGELLIYSIEKTNVKESEKEKNEKLEKEENDKNTKLLYSQETKSEISKLELIPYEKGNYLFVCYFDGTIEVFETDIKSSGLTNMLKSINIIKVSDNENRIIGLGYNSNTKYIYTACYNEWEIGISFVESKNKISKLPASKDNLIGFNYFNNNNKGNFVNYPNLYISYDINGTLFIGSISKDNSVINLLFVLENQLKNISLFKTDFKNCKIFIGDSEGNFDMFGFNLKKKNDKGIDNEYFNLQREYSTSLQKDRSYINEVFSFNLPFGVRDALYNPNKKDIYICLNNGTIQILSHFKDFSECIIDDNSQFIYRMIFNKNYNILFSGGYEKKIYGFSIPGYFSSEMTRRYQEGNLLNILDDIRICQNSILNGYDKTTSNMRKKSFSEKYILAQNKEIDNNEIEGLPSFLSKKI